MLALPEISKAVPMTWAGSSPHTRVILDGHELTERVNRAAHRLVGRDFDAIAVQGISGIVFGTRLSVLLPDKNLVIVRKRSEGQHSPNTTEGPDRVGRYIFVDDLISSATTLRRTVDGVRARYPHARCVGIYVFHPCENNRYSMRIDERELLIEHEDDL